MCRLGRAFLVLLLFSSSQVSAAGLDLAPQRPDLPVAGPGTAATLSNGTTVLWLWKVDNDRAGRHLYAAIADPAGNVRVPAKVVMPYIDQFSFGATVAPGGYVLYRRVGDGVEQRTFSDVGVLGPPVRVSAMQSAAALAPLPPAVAQMPATQERLRLVSDGIGFLVLWVERGGTGQRIVAQALDRDGTPEGPSADVVRIAGAIGDHEAAFGGTSGAGQSLVIWQNGSQIFGARVTASGSVIDSAPFVIADAHDATRLGIASDGSDFLVTWIDRANLYGTIVTANGHAGPARVLVPADPQVILSEPVVAFDGTQYVVAYAAGRAAALPCDCSIEDDVKAIRVGRDGTPRDTLPATLATAVAPSHLAIASSGHEFVITYASHYSDLAAITVHADATLHADPPVLLFHWLDLVSPSVSWTGDSYVVSFRYPSRGWDLDGTGEWYLGAIPVGADGSRGRLLATRTGPARDVNVDPPAVSANGFGDVALALSESRAPGEMPRAVRYTLDDLQYTTTPEAPLLTWRTSSDGAKLFVTWPDQWTDERGFLLLLYTRSGGPDYDLGSDTTSLTVPAPAGLELIELRVWSMGGFASARAQIPLRRTRAGPH